jgi:hypothetical protein
MNINLNRTNVAFKKVVTFIATNKPEEYKQQIWKINNVDTFVKNAVPNAKIEKQLSSHSAYDYSGDWDFIAPPLWSRGQKAEFDFHVSTLLNQDGIDNMIVDENGNLTTNIDRTKASLKQLNAEAEKDLKKTL